MPRAVGGSRASGVRLSSFEIYPSTSNTGDGRLRRYELGGGRGRQGCSPSGISFELGFEAFGVDTSYEPTPALVVGGRSVIVTKGSLRRGQGDERGRLVEACAAGPDEIERLDCLFAGLLRLPATEGDHRELRTIACFTGPSALANVPSESFFDPSGRLLEITALAIDAGEPSLHLAQVQVALHRAIAISGILKVMSCILVRRRPKTTDIRQLSGGNWRIPATLPLFFFANRNSNCRRTVEGRKSFSLNHCNTPPYSGRPAAPMSACHTNELQAATRTSDFQRRPSELPDHGGHRLRLTILKQSRRFPSASPGPAEMLL